jgi:Zn-dependent membrane protease YugP
METIIFIVLIALFIMAFVLFYSSYNQYKKSPSKGDLTGFDAAQAVTRDYNLDNYIIEQRGSYTDNYNYNKKVIKLSSIVFHDNNNYSVAMGYFIAMQAVLDKENNKMFKIRKLFEPLFYALMAISYLGIVLLAFANLDVMFLITILGLCLIYE